MLDNTAPTPALDFTDRLSVEGASRHPSPLKGLLKYMSAPEMISLGGGLPHASLFPITNLSVDVASKSADPEYVKTSKVHIRIQPDKQDGVVTSLVNTLQYGNGRGVEAFTSILRQYTQDVHRPLYSDWEVIASCGNTDAWAKCVNLLCDRGDWCIMDEWTYPAVMETILPLGIRPLGIVMDGEGMVPAVLERVLEEWDENVKGKRPRLIYLIPTGQNPTGATMSLPRRQAIYAIAQRFNLIIAEDDPYYCMQFPPYDPSSTRPVPVSSPFPYIPSFLSLDTDGRVIRLDSFSKVLFPGARCGWITTNRQFAAIFQYHNEVTCQQPSGFSQAILAQLLSEHAWGMAGWKRHLHTIRDEYARRRDHFLRAVGAHVDQHLVEFVVPSAGMFVWFKITPLLDKRKGGRSKVGGVTAEELFERFIAAKCLLVPGHNFSAERFGDWDNAPYFRATYANATFEDMEVAVKRFGDVLRRTFA